MSLFASRLRNLFCGSDRLQALAAEADMLERERARAGSVQAALERHFQCEDASAVTLGHAVEGG